MTDQDKISSYVSERLDQYYNWYDKKASTNKTNYQRGRILSAIGAVLIPVVSNLDLTFELWGKERELDVWIVTILGLAVALYVALEGVLHHREQWVNYRSTAEYLKTQKILFEHRTDDYEKLGDEEAFKLLVVRVEKAIAEENAVTLNVLTRSDEQSNGHNQSG